MTAYPIKVLFAGDFIPPLPHATSLYSKNLLNVLSDKDFSIVNLEAPLTQSTDKILKTGNNFKSHPDAVQHLISGKFDAVALANNHIRDFGGEGVLDTLKICKKNNILTVGAGENVAAAAVPLVITIKGKKIGILNFSEKEFNIASRNSSGANPFEAIDVFYQVQNVKAVCDVVFVIYHGGLEYHYLPAPFIIKRLKFLIDAGADGVVSHHTHRYSGVIEYRHKPIFFGLGNFLSSTKAKVTNDWLVGVIVVIIIHNDGIEYKIIPTNMARDFSSVDVLFNSENKKIMAHIDILSSQIKNDGKIKEYWDQVYRSEADRTINLLKSNSRLEYRIRKRIPILKQKMSTYKFCIFLNLIRCDSHRVKLIEILNKEYRKI